MTVINRRNLIRSSALAALAVPPAWSAFASSAQPRTAEIAPQIVTSFSILADMVREIVPAALEVSSLVGPDADAHVFEPTPVHGKRLAQAGLVVVNGLGFEGWINRLVRVSGYGGPLVVASAGITPRQGGHHGTDPHAWQDLALAGRYVATLRDAIAARWPQHQAELRARSAAYLERISVLDRQVREQLAVIPRAQRRVITSHDAFGYYAAAYGVDFFAPQGWNTHSEPSAAAVGRLIRQIKQEGVRALFVENISDPRLIQLIAQEAGARVGGTLYSDALSSAGGPASTYLKLFEHNTRVLVAALTAALTPSITTPITTPIAAPITAPR